MCVHVHTPTPMYIFCDGCHWLARVAEITERGKCFLSAPVVGHLIHTVALDVAATGWPRLGGRTMGLAVFFLSE